MPSPVVKKTELRFRGLLHRLFHLILGSGDSTRIPVRPEDVRSMLIIRPDKLGDMITTIPAAHALKKMFPHIRLEIIASPLNRQLVVEDPCFAEVHTYCKNILKDLPLIFRLRKKRFDIILDSIWIDSVTSLLLTRLVSNGAIRAAFRKQKLIDFYDYCEPHQPDGQEHNIDNGLLVFNLFGIRPDSVDPFLPVFLPESSRATATEFLQTLGDNHTFRIGLNISAGGPTRYLTLSKYAALLDRITKEYPLAQCVVVCISEDRANGRQLVANRAGKAHLVPEGLSLLEVAAIIEKCDLFISPDTSLIHLARLMKIPVVGLYCADMRNYHSWKPYRQEHGSVVSSHPGHIYDIEPAQIFDEVQNVLKAVYPDGPKTIASSQ